MFLSTPPSRVATVFNHHVFNDFFVSIHATLAGGDPVPGLRLSEGYRFYPRHPRGWRQNAVYELCHLIFVSIHATLAGGDSTRQGMNQALFCFYPRHPRGWRPSTGGIERQIAGFLSTPPSRVATSSVACEIEFLSCFYPRHPRGWRPAGGTGHCTAYGFLSTPPSRVATSYIVGNRHAKVVSIHATLAGGDVSPFPVSGLILCFYPRHPRGWRRVYPWHRYQRRAVSIHATLAGGDWNSLRI